MIARQWWFKTLCQLCILTQEVANTGVRTQGQELKTYGYKLEILAWEDKSSNLNMGKQMISEIWQIIHCSVVRQPFSTFVSELNIFVNMPNCEKKDEIWVGSGPSIKLWYIDVYDPQSFESGHWTTITTDAQPMIRSPGSQTKGKTGLSTPNAQDNCLCNKTNVKSLENPLFEGHVLDRNTFGISNRKPRSGWIK
jgi:hypothetical protein